MQAIPFMRCRQGIAGVHASVCRPRKGIALSGIDQVRIARQQPFELKMGVRASAVCWGVIPSGMLRRLARQP
jgi:hypothetical protein